MGEGTPRLNAGSDAHPDAYAPRATAQQLGGEIAVVRRELDTLLGELDRRRHEALDVPLQLRRHATGATLTALAFLLTAAGGVWLTVWNRRRRARYTARAGRLRHALARMTEHPERVAAEPTIPGKILTAAASAAVAALVKRGLERAVEQLMTAAPEEADRRDAASIDGSRARAVAGGAEKT
jgi:hypothetical protein